MALSEQQQDAISAARAAKSKQDPSTPFLIHRENGRLMPNTVLLRKHKDYRPYTGSVKASHEERMLFLRTGSSRPRMVNSVPEEAEAAPFDLGKATKDEIVAFAFTEFGAAFDPGTDIRTLRKQLAALAEPKQADSLS